MLRSNSDRARETRALAGIAGGVSLTMFAQLAIDAIEAAMVARLGPASLAGFGLALGLYSLVFLFSLGVVTSVTPLAAHVVGRGDAAAVRRFGQGGIVVALAVSLPLGLALLLLGFVPAGNGVVLAEAQRYLAGAACGLPGWVIYVAIRCFAVATGQVRLTTVVMAAAVPVHAGLAWTLIFGAELGVAGAGLALSLTGLAALGLVAAILVATPAGAFGAALRPPIAIDRASIVAILRLGLPFAIRIVLREGVLPVASLGLAPLGPVALAAHTAVSRIVALAGVFAFGLSDAANVQVSLALGASDVERVRRAGRIALGLALAVGLPIAASLAALRLRLAGWALGPGDPAVLRATASTLPIGAALLILEGVLAAGSGTLNGMRDARGTLAIAVVGGWLIGLPLGLVLARWLPPAAGLWTGLVLGWLIGAVLTLARFAALTRR